MELARAYQALLNFGKRHSYMMNDSKVVYSNGWAWIVVFQALNRHNYAIVKFYNGKYEVVEV